MASERKLQINFLYGRFHTGAFYPVVEPATSMWRGTGGREPGRTGGGRGTGDGRRKGGRQDLYDGGKRERNSKGKLLFFVTAYFQSKKSCRNSP